MEKKEFYLPSSDGRSRLHCVQWIPDGPVTASVQIVHGMTEHVSRYEKFAAFLASNGIFVYGHDHLGHGETAGKKEERGFFGERDGGVFLIRDMRRVWLWGTGRYPKVPHFILGHSMGSFLLRRYLTVYEDGPDGVILSGTGAPPAPAVTAGWLLASAFCWWRGPRFRARLLYELSLRTEEIYIATEYVFAEDVDIGFISRVKEAALAGVNIEATTVRRYHTAYAAHILGYTTGIQSGDDMEALREKGYNSDDKIGRTGVEAAFEEDEQCSFVFTAGAYRDFFRTILLTQRQERAGRIPVKIPVLFLSGTMDPVGERTKGVRRVFRWYDKAGAKDLTLGFYKGARHEVLNEINRGEVYEDALEWLKNHM